MDLLSLLNENARLTNAQLAVMLGKTEEEVEKEKFDTCKHAKRTGNFAVYTKPTCKQATMIRGRLVVSKARCLKCELWEPKKTRRKKDADQKSE